MAPWIDPTPRVRWGDARWRYVVGLVTIVLGAAATNLTSTFSLWFLLIGPCVQLLGWLILPGALWRRLAVLLPCLLGALVLLAGPDFVGAYAALLAGWLFARHRPLLSYLAVIPVIVLSFVLKAALNEYGQNWIGLLSGALLTVTCAWLGWGLAVWRRRRIQAWRVRRALRGRHAMRRPIDPAPVYGPGTTAAPTLSASPAGGPNDPE